MVDFNLVKQVTDLADWFFGLPAKLVSAVMEPQKTYYEDKERIAKLKELQAIRELGEHLQSLLFFKGNIYRWINRLQVQEQVEEVEYVRDLFVFAIDALKSAEQVMKDNSFSSLTLVLDATQKLIEARQAYESFAALSDVEILQERRLIDIVASMEDFQRSGSSLIMHADSHRKELEDSAKS
ncbi:MAG TPA: hypothetical protein VJM08_03525 [Anaerolineales bacterium]|nr:hypothetical protein [Anaerolineales bacterium]